MSDFYETDLPDFIADHVGQGAQSFGIGVSPLGELQHDVSEAYQCGMGNLSIAREALKFLCQI